MTEVTEEAMDSSAVSDEEAEDQLETSKDNQSSSSNSNFKISAAGEIVAGKRAKKTVERLDFQAPKQKEKLKFGDGSGEKLGEIPRIGYQITKMKPADLKPLHTILFDRPGKMATMKKTLRLFNGFAFDADSEHYGKKREKLVKNFTNSKLKMVCGVLDLEKKGTHLDLVDRIMTFLIEPKNSGKRLTVKKKRKSKKKLSGDDSNAKTMNKSKPKSSCSSSSPKKSKSGSKSKAIVMDSSSDEDEEDEKAGASAEAEGSDADDKPSEKGDEQSDKSEESEEDEEEEEEEEEEEKEEEESPKSKSARGKSSKKAVLVKRPRTPVKKTGPPPRKRAKKEVSEESEPDAESEEEKPRKKKPAAKTKKADSSSNSRTNTNTVEESSDEDEPLIKMVKKAPSHEQLKETVRSLLKEANLEEMTMKQICQRVFDTYPDHDLSGKKDYIKQTVKSLIT